VVFQLLKTLFEAPDHARNEAELADAVWGRSVRKNTLWCACRRARHALVQIDHPLRVAMDGERVMLV
jgi:DNA-binding winged helix-turn-helix (wHTH) protein